MKHRIYLIITTIIPFIAFSIATAQESPSTLGECYCASLDSHRGGVENRNDSYLPVAAPSKHTAERRSHSEDKTGGTAWQNSGSTIGSHSVYICTGSKAYAYHKKNKCRGLNNCQSKIIAVSQSDAENAGYRKCKICYR